ncbi:hypothetical protein [Lysinibacillus sphaericus]|uniref:hypothetical protein n=1 Tax=Lysinibacillus sphaericus TaxID=1421 RepID=UPI003D0581AD
MKNSAILTIAISITLLLVGTKLIYDYNSLKNSYIETFEAVMEPVSTLGSDPSFITSFNPEEYLKGSTNKIFDSTFEALKYRFSLPLGIASIISGLTALFFREKISDFFFKAFRFLF